MKTLKSFITLALITTLAIVASASTYNEVKFEVQSTNDLKSVLSQKIKADYFNVDNYLQQSNIQALKESVEVVFFISKEKKVKLISAQCKNHDASDYVYTVLNNSKINIDDSMVNKKYKVTIKLDYQN